MAPSPTDKTKTIKNKNSKTIIQEARLNISTNNPNTSFSSSQNNSNSLHHSIFCLIIILNNEHTLLLYCYDYRVPMHKLPWYYVITVPRTPQPAVIGARTSLLTAADAVSASVESGGTTSAEQTVKTIPLL